MEVLPIMNLISRGSKSTLLIKDTSESVKEDTPVVISVFNLKGQKVKTLVDKTVFAGDHKIIWQGDSDSGSSVSSGVYFVKMITGNHIETRKIVLMK